jgi:excisionase family DNA binding protein
VTRTEALPHLLTIDQLVERLGTSTRHVRRLIAERRIPYLKVGKLVRFDPDDISRWLDDSRVAQRPSPTGVARSRIRPVDRRGTSGGVA